MYVCNCDVVEKHILSVTLTGYFTCEISKNIPLEYDGNSLPSI